MREASAHRLFPEISVTVMNRRAPRVSVNRIPRPGFEGLESPPSPRNRERTHLQWMATSPGWLLGREPDSRR